MPTIGSILHGAYGDYYEQMICLKLYKRNHPGTRLVLFFASEHRLRELGVFDLSFADEVHPARAISEVPVDRFLQFQAHDPELRAEVLAKLPGPVLDRIDTRSNLKPWSILRTMDLHDPDSDIGLGPEGRRRLPWCYRENGLDEALFEERFTVGFLWRHRAAGGAVSHKGQTPEEVVRGSKADLFSTLIERHDAHILVCGMNTRRTGENYHRIEAKYTERDLGLDPGRCTYLKGLGWGLELEILKRCSLCIVMPSGFSEALWIKRGAAPTVLVDPPPHYMAKIVWNRMPLFGLKRPSELLFQIRQPHTAPRVLRHLERRRLLPGRIRGDAPVDATRAGSLGGDP